jgi:predicted nucleic acid-binding protein
MIVVDANVIVYLYTANVYAARAAALLEQDAEWIAPPLWRSESRNALVGIVRRGALLLEDARAIQSEAEHVMFGAEYQVDSALVLDLAERSDCSAYDCEYVALAKQLGLKLATMDRRVLQAFPEVAVPLPEV